MQSEQKGGIYLYDEENKLHDIFETKSFKELQERTGYPHSFNTSELDTFADIYENTKSYFEEVTPYKNKDGVEKDKIVCGTYINGFITMVLNAIDITCVSYQSSYGFIFLLEVDENDDNLKFFTASRKCIDNNDTECREKVKGKKNGETNPSPINKILLKITFLNESGLKYDVPFLTDLNFDDKENEKLTLKENGKDFNKITETETNFKKESKIQQEIFKKTYQYEPVTFGLIASCTIKDVKSVQYFLQLLRSKANERNTYKILDHIINIANENNFFIGINAMEYGNNYEVLSEHITNKKDKEKLKLYANIFFKILILLNIIDFKDDDEFKPKIHTDLHQNNIMVNKSQSKTLRYNIKDLKAMTIELPSTGEFKPYTYIIDYGNIIELEKNIEMLKLIKYDFDILKQQSKQSGKLNTSLIDKTKENIIKIILRIELEHYHIRIPGNKGYLQSVYLYNIFLTIHIKNRGNYAEMVEIINNLDEKLDTEKINMFATYLHNLILWFYKIPNTPDSNLIPGQLYNGETYNLEMQEMNAPKLRVKNFYDTKDIVLLEDTTESRVIDETDLTLYKGKDISSEIDVLFNQVEKEMEEIDKLRGEKLKEKLKEIRKAITVK